MKTHTLFALLISAALLGVSVTASAQHDHADHADHDDHGHEEEGVTLTPEVMSEFGIELAQAKLGSIAGSARLPGEVVYNADRIAHVTPTVSGIVRSVNVSVGDRVEAGDVLAVLNSREVAAARSDYLAAQARLELAKETFERDERLFNEKVGTERAVLESRQLYREAQIAQQQAENNLHALGFSHEQVAGVAALRDTAFTYYELIAPLGGVVTQRHLTIGEVIEPTDGDAPFVVADLSSVWIDLTVYQRDLAHITAGSSVELTFGHGIPDASGEVTFISPALDEKTRTATARVVLDNAGGQWRPGLFVTGHAQTGDAAAQSIVVPRSAVTEVEGEMVVFVQHDESFEPRPVRLGQTTDKLAEIVAGLDAGETFVATNVLALKAELNRGALEHAGHAH